MQKICLGRVHPDRYKQCDVNMSALRAEVLCSSPHRMLPASFEGDAVFVHVNGWALPRVPCGPLHAPPGQRHRAWDCIFEAMCGLYAARRVTFLLVYTCDKNVFVMLAPLLLVGSEYVALPPWNGWCREEGEARMLRDNLWVQSVTPIAAVEDAIRAAASKQGVVSAQEVGAVLKTCKHYVQTLANFEIHRRDLTSWCDQCAKLFFTGQGFAGVLTYTSVIPGLLLSVGEANHLISQGVASERLCALVLQYTQLFVTDGALCTDRDELWFLFYAQLVLKLAHKFQHTNSYRSELGEDIRPVYSSDVYGTAGDCEDHMGCLLTVVRAIFARRMLRNTCFAGVDISACSASQLYAARGCLSHAEVATAAQEVHAFTVLLRHEGGGVCLHIIENTVPVFVFRSAQQQDSIAKALAPSVSDVVTYASEDSMRARYCVQWLETNMLFELTSGGGGPSVLSLGARPYSKYAFHAIFEQDPAALALHLASVAADTARRTSLLLLSPQLFFSTYDKLAPLAQSEAPSDSMLEHAAALAGYFRALSHLSPVCQSLFQQSAEPMDENADRMHEMLSQGWVGANASGHDLRLLPCAVPPFYKPPNPNLIPGKTRILRVPPPMLNTVRLETTKLYRELQNNYTLSYNDPRKRCPCLVKRCQDICTLLNGYSGYYQEAFAPNAIFFRAIVQQHSAYQECPKEPVSQYTMAEYMTHTWDLMDTCNGILALHDPRMLHQTQAHL